MNETTKFPLDFDTLQKGSVIGIPALENITGHKAGTDKYDFGVMALRQQIERELQRRGHNWTVAQIDRQLKVLTDGEAVVYNERQFARGRAMELQAHWRAQGVDVANLSDAEKERHTRNLCLQAAEILAARTARKLELKTQLRDVPTLDGK